MLSLLKHLGVAAALLSAVQAHPFRYELPIASTLIILLKIHT